MKKILFINSSLTDGGSERVMTLIANAISSDNRFDVNMVLLREKEKDTYELSKYINCIRFRYGNSNKIKKARKRFSDLRKIIKNGNYDYIISFMYDINIFTLFASIGIKTKIIVSERNNPKSKGRKITKILENILYNKAYKIVFQTDEVKKMYSKKIQKKSIVIPNPINCDLPGYFNSDRKKEIVSVGRLTEQKNFEMLIRVFYNIHMKFKDYKLIIYGEGHLRPKLEKMINNLGMNNYIKLPGYISNVNEKIVDTYIFVLPSNYEGISNAMLEAMAMGIPTICTDCPIGGARMVIRNYKNGILIPVNDKFQLEEKITQLIVDNKLYKRISKESLKIKSEFSLKQISEIWKSILI